MGQISLQIPQSGQSFGTEGPKVATDLTTIQTWANGNVDSSNVSNSFAQSAMVNTGTQTVKGASNIATSQSTSSTTYTTLTTPDQVTGIVLPTNGLIAVWFQATWQGPAAGNQNAAIFLGSNQAQIQGFDSVTHGPLTQAALLPADTGAQPLFSYWGGLGSSQSASATYGADVTTGQIVGYSNVSGQVASTLGASNFTSGASSTVFQAGGPCYMFAAAGTYTVSVQFKTSTGSVTASNRKLWVQALSFS